MEILDSSIANVCLPHIAGSLSATPEEATWAVTSYLVANAIVLPLTAWLSSRFGRKQFLVTCTIIFTIASGLSGAATSLGMLIAARVLQGLGGGALQPIAQAVMLESFPAHKRGQAMAVYGMGVVVAPILGPILGGYITDNYDWRWSFYINLPVGIIAVIMALLFLENPPFLAQHKTRKIDYLGFFSLALWVGALQVMLDKGEQEEWFSSALIVALAITFAIFVMFFLNWESWTDEPVVDLKILGNRNFGIAAFLITVVGAVLYGSVTVLPLFLQNLLGYPAYDSGLAIAPRGLGAFCANIVLGPLLTRYDGRIFVGSGFVMLALSNIWLSDINTQIAITNITYPNVLQGVAIACIFVPLTTLASSTLPIEQFGMASGIYNLMRNLGGGIGIALCTTFITRGSQMYQNTLITHITPYSPAYLELSSRLGGLLPTQQAYGLTYGVVLQQATMLAYINIYLIMGALCFACVPLVFLMERGDSGPKKPSLGH